MRIKMVPSIHQFDKEESGIRRVVEAYYKYLPEFDVRIVEPDNEDFDLLAIHAGFPYTLDRAPGPIVDHCHGLYWTADYPAAKWERAVNQLVVNAVRHACAVTVPSRWVQEVFQRDMHFSPFVVPHGIDVDEWQNNQDKGNYVLWNKNRALDVCDPRWVRELALQFPDVQFITTFAPQSSPSNVRAIGTVPHAEMKQLIQQAGVYLSTAKETFGIGVLEAMASGVPVLGFKHGGNVDLIEHGVDGYLATSGSIDDLSDGLEYCFRWREVLGGNGKELAKKWSWREAAGKLRQVYEYALDVWNDEIRPYTIDPAEYGVKA